MIEFHARVVPFGIPDQSDGERSARAVVVGYGVWSLIDDIDLQAPQLGEKLRSLGPATGGVVVVREEHNLRALADEVRAGLSAGVLGSEVAVGLLLDPHEDAVSLRSPLVLAGALDLLADLAGPGGVIEFIEGRGE